MHSAETADFCMLIPLKPTVTDTMSSSVYTERTHVQSRPILTPPFYFGEHDGAAGLLWENKEMEVRSGTAELQLCQRRLRPYIGSQ